MAVFAVFHFCAYAEVLTRRIDNSGFRAVFCFGTADALFAYARNFYPFDRIIKNLNRHFGGMDDIFCKITTASRNNKVACSLKRVKFVCKAQGGGAEKGSAVLFGELNNLLRGCKIRCKGFVYVGSLSERQYLLGVTKMGFGVGGS